MSIVMSIYLIHKLYTSSVCCIRMKMGYEGGKKSRGKIWNVLTVKNANGKQMSKINRRNKELKPHNNGMKLLEAEIIRG